MRTGPLSYNAAYEFLRAQGYEPVPGSSRFENALGRTGRIVDAGGRGDRWYAETDEPGVQSANSTGSFARGFGEGRADRESGHIRQLCTTGTGERPPVVKRHDRDFYHGYKASAEGATSEPAAYIAYRAKHRGRSGMAANARRHTAEPIAKRWMRDTLQNDTHGEFVDPRTGEVNLTRLAEECAFVLNHPDWLDDETHPVWDWAIEAAEEGGFRSNPMHLGLDGNFSFSVGTKDAEHMKRNEGAGKKVWEDTLLTWTATNRGLTMSPSPEGITQAREMLEDREMTRPGHRRRGALDEQADFLEVAMGNGWAYVNPEDVGAMTDATIISQDGFIGDNGKWYPHPDVERPVVYAHMNYAVEDPIEKWAAGESVFWVADELELTNESRQEAIDEYERAMGETYSPNARKNVTAVIDAFQDGRARREATCSTDGKRIYSYSMLIAARMGADGEPTTGPGRVLVLDTRQSPSVTTSAQINAVRAAIPDAEVVTSFPVRATHAPNARRSRMKTPQGLTAAQTFFFEHAGYSYPTGATAAKRKAARVENAKALAAAEPAANSRGWTFEWEYDDDPDTSWMSDEDLADLHSGRTELLSVLLKDEQGNVLDSLGGVHVKAPARNDPYVRVVEAEMAAQALRAEESAGRAMALNPGRRRQARPNWRMMLDLPGVTRRLGASHVAAILASDTPQAVALGQAADAWERKDVKNYEAYQSLARMIDDGEMDDLIQDARAGR